jgi:hypothetical protein
VSDTARVTADMESVLGTAELPAIGTGSPIRIGIPLADWQSKLLPFMMCGLGAVALVFFVGTFWNYYSLNATLAHEDPKIAESIAAAQSLKNDAFFADWYVRSVLEERALAGRQRQYSAVIQSRLWTRMMGFLAGMVTLLAGAIFILGKLEVEFDGRAKVTQGEGSIKTNSPGLVLVVAGALLMVISLIVTVEVKSQDQLVYLPAFEQPARPMEGAITSTPTTTSDTELVELMCKQSPSLKACKKN